VFRCFGVSHLVEIIAEAPAQSDVDRTEEVPQERACDIRSFKNQVFGVKVGEFFVVKMRCFAKTGSGRCYFCQDRLGTSG
jgi:hypothetical protein